MELNEEKYAIVEHYKDIIKINVELEEKIEDVTSSK